MTWLNINPLSVTEFRGEVTTGCQHAFYTSGDSADELYLNMVQSPRAQRSQIRRGNEVLKLFVLSSPSQQDNWLQNRMFVVSSSRVPRVHHNQFVKRC